MPQYPRPSAPLRLYDWRGTMRRKIRDAQDWYAEQLRECGALVDDLTPRYVGAMPDVERKGEP